MELSDQSSDQFLDPVTTYIDQRANEIPWFRSLQIQLKDGIPLTTNQIDGVDNIRLAQLQIAIRSVDEFIDDA